jgi:hypothetical protein
MEEANRENTGRLFKFVKADVIPDISGGINAYHLEDFWQLPLTGNVAIMTNPYSGIVLQCAKANPFQRGSVSRGVWSRQSGHASLPQL